MERVLKAVCEADATISVAELTAVEHLGQLYRAHESWAIHESIDVRALKPPAL